MFGASAIIGAYSAQIERDLAMKKAKHSAEELMIDLGMPIYFMGNTTGSCHYCKRTKHTNGHKSCDGCGAPR